MAFSHWYPSRKRHSGNRAAQLRQRRRLLQTETLESRSLLATIQGTVFNDLDADGVIDFGDNRLPNWQVYLDTNGNGVLDTNAGTVTRASPNVPRAIPDVGVVTSLNNVTGLTGTITDLDVQLTIDHTWDEDLEVFLRSPAGTRVELFSDVGGSGRNFTNTRLDDEASQSILDDFAPFTGTYRPENPLRAFDGEVANGTWTLEVFDDSANDTGRLTNWSLIFSTQSFGEPVALSDSQGAYQFSGLPGGTYNVRSVAQPGWSTTFPTGGVHVLSLAGADNAAPINFGQRQSPSTLRGTMWNDFDGDGARDTGEPALPNRTVYLDRNDNGVLDVQSFNQTFADSPGVVIPNNGAVRAAVLVPLDQGRVIDLDVTLAISHGNVSDLSAVLISPSGTRVQLFANVGGSGSDFNGTRFDQSATTPIGSGVAPFTGSFRPAQPLSRFNGESARGTWYLEVSDNSGGAQGTLDSWSLIMRRVNAERSTRTDASGAYAFFNVAPGSYDVAQVPQAGFVATAPRSAVLVNDQVIDISQRSNQREHQPTVAVDPSNPNRLFMAATLGSGTGLFGAVSVDGGATWAQRTVTGVDSLPAAANDADVAFDELGNLFLTYVAQTGDVIVALSTNGGTTFSQPTILAAASGAKTSVVAANGTVWVSFTQFNKIQISGAVITSLGVVGNFSSPVSPAESIGSTLSDMDIGPNGELIVTYQTGNSIGPSVIRASIDPDGLGTAPFNSAVVVSNTNVSTNNSIPAQTGYNVNAGVRVAWDRSGGGHNGRVYVAYSNEIPDGSTNLDVFLRYSDNSGASWSAPVRANDVTTRSQFLPRLALDQTNGDLAVTWYDARNDDGIPLNGSSDDIVNNDVEVFAALSIDGGVSFQNNLLLSGGFTNALVSNSPRGFGDHAGLAFFDGVIHPVWVDNSNSTGNNPDGPLGDFDLYTAAVRVTTGGQADYRVLLAAGSFRNDLHFANHRNPVLTSFTSPRTYVENSALIVAPSGIVGAATTPNFDLGSLVVRFAANSEGSDRLVIRNQGNGPGQVGVQGSDVRVAGVVVGVFSGGTSPQPLLVRFNSNASAAEVQRVIRNIAFRSLSDNPSTLPRQITFDLADGHRGISNTATVDLNVQLVNDPPRIFNFGPAVRFEEDLPAITIAVAATIVDPDSSNFASGTLAVTLTQNAQSSDQLRIRSTGVAPGQVSVVGNQVRFGGAAIGTFSGGLNSTPLVVTFNALATSPAVQEVLRSVTFETLGDNPSTLARQVSMVLTDGDGGQSATLQKNIQIRAIADAPVLSNLSGTIGYTLNSPAIFIATTAVVSDVDSTHFGGGRLTVAIGPGIDSKNRLEIGGGATLTGGQVRVGGVVIGTLNADGGVGETDLIVTFNSSATIARVQQLIRGIKFRTIATTDTTNRVVTFALSDGTGGVSSAATRTIQIQ